ncbi:S8 family serine peptidase [Cellulomonas sp. IC4_254]|uniref:S8 family serine peptidase n=1 Tax=Cellulomonas sp. IC4_254 TaxID=2714040 RepID=UPI0014246598|nr:S8 family serine peptidase [Cellulomonas sp. IC4_254]
MVATMLGSGWAAASNPGAEDGRWYYEATGLADLHQRTTGTGITIAVLDEAVNLAAADLVGADVQPHEPSYCAAEEGGAAYPATSTEALAKHTTSIATMLVGTDAGVGGAPGIPGVAPGATVRTYAIRYGDQPCETPAGQESYQDDAIRDAIADGADIIAVPGAGRFTTDGIADALRAGVIVVAAAGNDGELTGLPAIANGVVTVGTVTSDVTLAEGSPDGPTLAAVAPGARIRAMQADWSTYGTTTGSSNATAYTAGALALLWSLYPDASDRQIIQALIHATDAEVKDTPSREPGWGYGTVSPRGLLATDPTSYPDENPLLLDDGRAPVVADVLGADQTATTPAEDAGDAVAGTDDTTPAVAAAPSTPVGAWVGGAAGALLIAGSSAAVVASRRRRLTADGTGARSDADPD